MRVPSSLFGFLLLCAVAWAHKVQQLNAERLRASQASEDFTLVYFYSATCNFCKEFTPKFEQLAKVYPESNVSFGKIDAITYKEITQQYNVTSYPTILLFWKNIDLPIPFRQEREVENLLNFLRASTKPLQNVIPAAKVQASQEELILFYGSEDSPEARVVAVLSRVERFRLFARVEGNFSQPYLEIKGEKFENFHDLLSLRTAIRKAFARLFVIEEESWLRIHQERQPGLIFIDTNNNQALAATLSRMAKDFPHVIFLRIDPSQEEFKPALDFLGLEAHEGVFGVDERAQAKFEAPQPYNEESLRSFLDGVLNLSLPAYLKTEKSNHKQKLTRENYEQKMAEPKDIVLFLYREDDRIQKKFMDLFKHLTEHLKDNKNLLLLRTNVSKNELIDKLEYDVKVTPWIIFFRHRMKNYPIHFQKPVISKQSVIEFIMENTTFDWEDEWGEL